MKIKKINEDKVQIIITNQDLEERDFKKWEIMPLSPKAQELFQDLLDMAYQECGFEIEDDSQLMVEAYPLSIDSFVVVMTKVRQHQLGEHIGFVLPHQQENEEDEEDSSRLDRGGNQVWSFPDLETCIQACSRLTPDYVDGSRLYKYQDAYYLVLEILPDNQAYVEAVVGEYGDWIAFDEVFLMEYGSLMVPREAVINLVSLIRLYS